VYKVFLVDDDHLIIDQFVRKAVFNEYRYEIIGSSTDPEEAVNEIRSLSPDVIITGLKMQKMTGIEMMKTLMSGGCKAEFVILCTYKDLAEVRRLFLIHRFEYLVKPVDDNGLIIILHRLSDKLTLAPPGKNIVSSSKELNEIIAYLTNYSAMRHTLESISEKWDINPNTVCNLFAKHLDTTFIAFLTGLRMDHAEEMLKTTDKSIKEVAYLCGYNDYFYFCRVFKEKNNCTPTEFRTANRKSNINKIDYRNNRRRIR